jgi:hypothetical protein
MMSTAITASPVLDQPGGILLEAAIGRLRTTDLPSKINNRVPANPIPPEAPGRPNSQTVLST